MDSPKPTAKPSRSRLILALAGAGAAVMVCAVCICGGGGAWWWYNSSVTANELSRPSIVVPSAGPGSTNEPVAVRFNRPRMKMGDVRFVSATHEVNRIVRRDAAVEKDITFLKFRGKVKTRGEKDLQHAPGKNDLQPEIAFLEIEELKITNDGNTVFDLTAGYVVPRPWEITKEWVIWAPDGTLTPLPSPYNARLHRALFSAASIDSTSLSTDEKHMVGGIWKAKGTPPKEMAQVTFTGVKNEERVYLEFFGKISDEKKNRIITFIAKVPHGAGTGVSHLTHLESEHRVEVLGDPKSGRTVRRTASDIKIMYEATFLPPDANTDADPYGLFLTEARVDLQRDKVLIWAGAHSVGTPRPKWHFTVQAIASNRHDLVIPLGLDKGDGGKGPLALSCQNSDSNFKTSQEVDLNTLQGETKFDFVVRSAPDAANVAQGKEIHRLKNVSLK